MLQDALASFETQIQPRKPGVFVLQLIDHAQRLQIVLETTVIAHALV